MTFSQDGRPAGLCPIPILMAFDVDVFMDQLLPICSVDRVQAQEGLVQALRATLLHPDLEGQTRQIYLESLKLQPLHPLFRVACSSQPVLLPKTVQVKAAPCFQLTQLPASQIVEGCSLNQTLKTTPVALQRTMQQTATHLPKLIRLKTQVLVNKLSHQALVRICLVGIKTQDSSLPLLLQQACPIKIVQTSLEILNLQLQ